MHRAVLQACLPWFLWLCLASGLALLMVQYCGGRIDWRRLKRLGRCEEGAVHSLSLVLTLPVFLMLILFIVQISQIMVAVMMVHYSAFAGARAASVWIPADVVPGRSLTPDPLDPSIVTPAVAEPANVVAANINGLPLLSGGYAYLNSQNATESDKYRKIVQASVLPLLTISPSRQIGSDQLPASYQGALDALNRVYSEIDPQSKQNSRMPQRLRNKLSYAANFTSVVVAWKYEPHPTADVFGGPTYNPYEHPAPSVPPWNPREIGFRDPVTVQVTHRFALLPGIGRILATRDPASTIADRVAGRIGHDQVNGQDLYYLELTASATFVNEGYKSTIPYTVEP